MYFLTDGRISPDYMQGADQPKPPGHIGRLLRVLRERAGLTQVELAQATGRSKQLINHYENRFKGDFLPPEFALPLSRVLIEKGVTAQEIAPLLDMQTAIFGQGALANLQAAQSAELAAAVQAQLTAMAEELAALRRLLTDAPRPAAKKKP